MAPFTSGAPGRGIFSHGVWGRDCILKIKGNQDQRASWYENEEGEAVPRETWLRFIGEHFHMVQLTMLDGYNPSKQPKKVL